MSSVETWLRIISYCFISNNEIDIQPSPKKAEVYNYKIIMLFRTALILEEELIY